MPGIGDMRFLSDVEGEARARFNTARGAVAHAACHFYVSPEDQERARLKLETGETVHLAYGSKTATIKPVESDPQPVNDAY